MSIPHAPRFLWNPSQGRQSVDDEGACEMHQPPIVLHQLLKADQEFPEPIVPCACAFDDPATRRVPSTSRDAFTAVAAMGSVMPLPDCRLDLREIIPFVETQVLRAIERRSGASDGEAIQCGRRRFHIVDVGAGHRDGQRGAALVGQRVAFRTELAAIRRIGTCLAPPTAP
jgi:hypothetical protein